MNRQKKKRVCKHHHTNRKVFSPPNHHLSSRLGRAPLSSPGQVVLENIRGKRHGCRHGRRGGGRMRGTMVVMKAMKNDATIDT